MVDCKFLCNTAVILVIVNCVVLVMLMELPLMHKFAPLSERIRVYEMMRDNVMRKEQYERLGGKMIMCDSEHEVNTILMTHKNREFSLGFRNSSNFKAAHHFLHNDNFAQMRQSPIFELLHTMPKGGALHAHDLALCSSEYLVQQTYRTNLWVCIDILDGKYKQLRFSHHVPKPLVGKGKTQPACRWTLLETLRSQLGVDAVDRQLHAQFTLYPQQHYDSASLVWQRFRKIFAFTSGLLTYADVWKDYMYHALHEFYTDGVQYLEIRSTLPILYDMDGTNYTIVNTTQFMYTAELMFRDTHPDWIGSKLIYAPSRNVDDTRFLQYLGNALLLKSTFPDYFVGFDLVSYEDAGRPLRDFAHQLIAVQTEINFYFHAGETNWYGTSSDDNLIDAVLLGTKRIGHGLALFKHPEVLSLVRSKDIAIEVNPISNQVLQYIGDDLRNHPSAFLFARDYAVVISSDDPSCWKAAPLTHDYYVAFMGIASFDSDLSLLKQLALNSIKYSALDENARREALLKWLKRWAQWIDNVADSQYEM